nr:uncharacterized mitochondrial protein AtMg00810-like [Tanacetum cinerariifolium]
MEPKKVSQALDDENWVEQSEEGIFNSQDKYVAEILKKFDFSSVKTAGKPIETQKPLVKDEVPGYTKTFISTSCEADI